MRTWIKMKNAGAQALAIGVLCAACGSQQPGQEALGLVEDVEGCSSGVTWDGAVVTNRRALIVEACVEDVCSTRSVTVTDDGICRKVVQWQDDIGSSVCATMSGSEARITFDLNLTSRADELTDGDVARFRVLEEEGVAFEVTESLNYAGSDGGERPCRTAIVNFGEDVAVPDGGAAAGALK